MEGRGTLGITPQPASFVLSIPAALSGFLADSDLSIPVGGQLALTKDLIKVPGVW